MRSARTRAALVVNAGLIELYHGIGRDILDRQTRHGWGEKVIARAAADLKAAFPDMKGFSTRNVKYMRYFAEHCPDLQFGQQPAAQLPWFHIITLLTKAEAAEREWYATRAVAEGWSRHTLEQNLKTRLSQRQGAAVTNFASLLPPASSALAQETLKDPYLFDFLAWPTMRTSERSKMPSSVTSPAFCWSSVQGSPLSAASSAWKSAATNSSSTSCSTTPG